MEAPLGLSHLLSSREGTNKQLVFILYYYVQIIIFIFQFLSSPQKKINIFTLNNGKTFKLD